ncbi:MAG TPA: hypothetical protein VLM42_19425 [Bryobacteraceae bacterium]|nr:hypothetical protein [Bryobacteraceae bacterium]
MRIVVIGGVAMIQEGSGCGFDQTHHTGNGRGGDGRSAAGVCLED